jgi:hypothetical protein
MVVSYLFNIAAISSPLACRLPPGKMLSQLTLHADTPLAYGAAVFVMVSEELY